MRNGCRLPEGEEILDFLLARRGADVLDVNSVCGHVDGCLCDDLYLICETDYFVWKIN